MHQVKEQAAAARRTGIHWSDAFISVPPDKRASRFSIESRRSSALFPKASHIRDSHRMHAMAAEAVTPSVG
jgi:hypothetical protein